MRFGISLPLAIIILFNFSACSPNKNISPTIIAFPSVSTLVTETITPANTYTIPPTQVPTRTPVRAPTKTSVILPTLDFVETDYSHFFDAYPPMMNVSYTPDSIGYEHWTPIVNELARKLNIPECKDWMMVHIIDTQWEDIFAHYEVTIVDNGWSVLSSSNNQTAIINGQTYNLGELRYDVGGDKERIIMVFDPHPELGNPYYILFFLMSDRHTVTTD